MNQDSSRADHGTSGAATLRIGVTLPLTNTPNSIHGNYVREGHELFVKHVNAKGGILGRKVELILLDDQMDHSRVADFYEKLISAEGAEVLLGPYGSEMLERVADIAERHCRIMLSPTAGTSGMWRKGRKGLFQVLAPLEGAATGFLDIAASNSLKTVGILHQEALTPNAIADGSADIAKRLGFDVVLREAFARDTDDFSFVKYLIEASIPEVLIIASSRLDHLTDIVRRLSKLASKPKMIACYPYGLLPEFYDGAKQDGEGVYSATFWEEAIPNPGSPDFVDAYVKECGRSPAVPSAAGYASLQVLKQAVETAGSTSFEPLRQALLALKTKTVLGDFAVDSTGLQIGLQGKIIRWKDGRREIVDRG